MDARKTVIRLIYSVNELDQSCNKIRAYQFWSNHRGLIAEINRVANAETHEDADHSFVIYIPIPTAQIHQCNRDEKVPSDVREYEPFHEWDRVIETYCQIVYFSRRRV